MRINLRPILPVDQRGRTVEFSSGQETEMLSRVSMIAAKRTRRILSDAAYGTMTLSQIVEAAYIQGMTDAAIASS